MLAEEVVLGVLPVVHAHLWCFSELVVPLVCQLIIYKVPPPLLS